MLLTTPFEQEEPGNVYYVGGMTQHLEPVLHAGTVSRHSTGPSYKTTITGEFALYFHATQLLFSSFFQPSCLSKSWKNEYLCCEVLIRIAMVGNVLYSSSMCATMATEGVILHRFVSSETNASMLSRNSESNLTQLVTPPGYVASPVIPFNNVNCLAINT